MATKVPPPGSVEAGKLGCTCPVLDNAHGRGWMGGCEDEDGGPLYVFSLGCPVHEPRVEIEDEEEPNRPDLPIGSLGVDVLNQIRRSRWL